MIRLIKKRRNKQRIKLSSPLSFARDGDCEMIMIIKMIMMTMKMKMKMKMKMMQKAKTMRFVSVNG